MTIYGPAYADQYDRLYNTKDYQGECDLIEQTFRDYAGGEIRTIVDWGCGTGNHSIPLAQRGYSITGVDSSAEMLRVAQRKSSELDAQINWIAGDLRTTQVGEPFDAGLFMFAVLGYMLSNEDMLAALTNARRHLRPGGLLAFDIWYGPAVLSIKPSARIAIVPSPDGKVIRAVRPTLDVRHHQCEVHYSFWHLVGDHVESAGDEIHTVRFFFPMELELMLSQSGFALISLTAFPTLERPADETTWNVWGVARAI